MSTPIHTIGHSTRTLDEFIDLLQAYGIRQLIDIRTAPRSRHNPQFNREGLSASLEKVGIAYRHMPGLGGLRRPKADSGNTGWRNASFRGYADYMQTPQFEDNLRELITLAEKVPTAVMCAEAVHWRCHRSLLADALVVRGVPVEHVHSRAGSQPHALTPFAELKGTRVTYPASQAAS